MVDRIVPDDTDPPGEVVESSLLRECNLKTSEHRDWGSESRGAAGAIVLCLLVMTLLCLGSARAGRWEEDEAAAVRGLVVLDSLLHVPAPTAAVATARQLWSTLGDNPYYGWQIEGRLGLALLLAGEAEAAVPHLENVIRRYPRESAHHRNLGAALLQMNRRGRALSEYGVAVELSPDDPDLRREYGQMLLSFRDTRGAERELLVARKLCGGCPESDQPLASLYLLQENFVLAVPPLQRLYRRDPGAVTRQPLVAAMSRAGNDSLLVEFIAGLPETERSRDEWRLLVEREGRLEISTHSLEVVQWLGRDPEAMLPAARAIVAGDDLFWGQVALNLLASADYDAGLKAVAQAIDLAPENVVYRNNYVVLLTKLGRDSEARAAWQKVLALDPSLAQKSP